MEYAPKGIANLGNTCYLNACIQILSRIEPLNNIILNKNFQNATKVESMLWKNWKDITSVMQNSSNNELLHPNGFVSAIEQVTKHKNIKFFSKNEPEDMSEFILFFIDCLHLCLEREITIEISGHSENKTDNKAIEVFKKLKEIFERKYSEIAMLFYGATISSIESIDATQVYSETADVFYILDLPILKQNCTLYECIDEYIKPEVLDGDNKWYNEKTNTYENINKSISFWSFPEVLVICLKRLNYDGSKNNSLVNYPLELDLRKYVVGYKKTTFVYDLVGICVHVGNIDIGHYTSFVKKDNHWFFCNDEKIRHVEKLEYLTTNHTHCLFYVKKNSAL